FEACGFCGRPAGVLLVDHVVVAIRGLAFDEFGHLPGERVRFWPSGVLHRERVRVELGHHHVRVLPIAVLEDPGAPVAWSLSSLLPLVLLSHRRDLVDPRRGERDRLHECHRFLLSILDAVEVTVTDGTLIGQPWSNRPQAVVAAGLVQYLQGGAGNSLKFADGGVAWVFWCCLVLPSPGPRSWGRFVVDRSGFLATQEQKGAHGPLPLDFDDSAILELERRGQVPPSALGDVDGAGGPLG